MPEVERSLSMSVTFPQLHYDLRRCEPAQAALSVEPDHVRPQTAAKLLPKADAAPELSLKVDARKWPETQTAAADHVCSRPDERSLAPGAAPQGSATTVTGDNLRQSDGLVQEIRQGVHPTDSSELRWSETPTRASAVLQRREQPEPVHPVAPMFCDPLWRRSWSCRTLRAFQSRRSVHHPVERPLSGIAVSSFSRTQTPAGE